MPEFHAKLGPSSSKQWIESPGCLFNEPPKMSKEAQAFLDGMKPESTASAEGTLGHELVEHKLRNLMLYWDKKRYPEHVKMPPYIELRKNKHYSYFLERMADWCFKQAIQIMDIYAHDDDRVTYLEKRVHMDSINPEIWGTADGIIVSEKQRTLHIFDYKFGRLPIHAAKNPQLMLYAYGAIEELGLWDRIRTVRATIIQPRNWDVDTAEFNADDLWKWGQGKVKRAAQAALDGTGKMRPTIEICRYCKHRVTDRAHRQMYIDLLGGWENMGKDPAKMRDRDIQKIVANAPAIKQWLDDVVNYATAQALDGKEFKKLKLVKGKTYRRFNADKEKAIKRKLKKAGFQPDEYLKPRQLKPLTEIEALVGKTMFEHDIIKYVNQSHGKDKLAPLNSKELPAATTKQQAEQDFANFLEK